MKLRAALNLQCGEVITTAGLQRTVRAVRLVLTPTGGLRVILHFDVGLPLRLPGDQLLISHTRQRIS